MPVFLWRGRVNVSELWMCLTPPALLKLTPASHGGMDEVALGLVDAGWTSGVKFFSTTKNPDTTVDAK